MVFAPYNTNIPFASDAPANDQPLMEQNTNSINSLVAIDHVGFNVNTSPATGGYHTIIHQTTQSSAPSAIAGINQLFALVPPSGIPPTFEQLFSLNGGGGLSQLTGNFSSSTGYCWAGGILIQWGGGSVSASGTATPFIFKVAFPNNLFAITIGCRTSEGVSPGANNQFIEEGSQSVTGFSIVNSSGSSARLIYYMAIGN